MRSPRLASAALLAGVLGLSACSHKTAASSGSDLPPAAVHTQKVESRSRVATEAVVGTVQPRLRAVIEAKVSARIEQMLVVPGQHVKAGDLLAQLDARELQSQLDQALAVRQQADSDLKRIQPLVQQKIAAQADLDAYQARFSVADAAAAQATTLVSYTKVLAPFDGTITRKDADVGDLASPGKALLEIEDSNNMRLEADVPEAAIGKLALGDRLLASIASVSNALECTVSEISPAVDPASHTFLVKCDLPASAGLRSGQFGRVAVPIGETSALRVSATAVIRRGQMELVFVADNGHAQLRIVKTGKTVGDEIELVSGVDAGEQVIVDHVAELVDGQRIEAAASGN